MGTNVVKVTSDEGFYKNSWKFINKKEHVFLH